MLVRKRILKLRRDQEKYLETLLDGELTDNDRLWAAIHAITEYLEENDTRQNGLTGGNNELR